MNKFVSVAYVAILGLIAGLYTADARPQYAQKEGKPCGYCHLNPAGGGARGYRGQFYGANKLSFAQFDDAREAKIAGIEPGASGPATDPKVKYIGNVGGPADRQIQLASIQGDHGSPVLVVFFDGSSDATKAALPVFQKLALAYGKRLPIIGVAEGDAKSCLLLTLGLGSPLRILPDVDGAAMKKFGASAGLDLVVVSPIGTTSKTFSGLSKSTLTATMAQISAHGLAEPKFDLTAVPDQALHGGPLGGAPHSQASQPLDQTFFDLWPL